MPYLLIGGRRLYFTDQQPKADGPTLLLLHGAAGNHLAWPHALRRLPGTRVLTLDLPGHGRSDPPGRRTIPHYAAVVHAFIAAIGSPPLVLAGHSMGGAIALATALDAPPPDVRGLVLMSVAAQLRVGDLLLGGALDSLERAAAFIADNGFSDAPVDLRQRTRHVIVATGSMTTFGDFLACSRFDAWPWLPAVLIPALVIGGTDDRLVSPKQTDALAQGLPRARRERLDGAGHFVMLERPDEVAALVARFLDSLRRPSAAHQHLP